MSTNQNKCSRYVMVYSVPELFTISDFFFNLATNPTNLCDGGVRPFQPRLHSLRWLVRVLDGGLQQVDGKLGVNFSCYPRSVLLVHFLRFLQLYVISGDLIRLNILFLLRFLIILKEFKQSCDTSIQVCEIFLHLKT